MTFSRTMFQRSDLSKATWTTTGSSPIFPGAFFPLRASRCACSTLHSCPVACSWGNRDWRARRKVLCFSQRGTARSFLVVAAYLLAANPTWTSELALRYLIQRRPCLAPSRTLLKSLLLFEDEMRRVAPDGLLSLIGADSARAFPPLLVDARAATAARGEMIDVALVEQVAAATGEGGVAGGAGRQMEVRSRDFNQTVQPGTPPRGRNGEITDASGRGEQGSSHAGSPVTSHREQGPSSPVVVVRSFACGPPRLVPPPSRDIAPLVPSAEAPAAPVYLSPLAEALSMASPSLRRQRLDGQEVAGACKALSPNDAKSAGSSEQPRCGECHVSLSASTSSTSLLQRLPAQRGGVASSPLLTVALSPRGRKTTPFAERLINTHLSSTTASPPPREFPPFIPRHSQSQSVLPVETRTLREDATSSPVARAEGRRPRDTALSPRRSGAPNQVMSLTALEAISPTSASPRLFNDTDSSAESTTTGDIPTRRAATSSGPSVELGISRVVLSQG